MCDVGWVCDSDYTVSGAVYECRVNWVSAGDSASEGAGSCGVDDGEGICSASVSSSDSDCVVDGDGYDAVGVGGYSGG